MKCKECGREMILDDYNFRGSDNKYWTCEYCMTSCVEQIRYGQTWRELWDSENESAVEYIIKHKFGLGN